MEVVLPAATPEAYLRWVAFWREVEAAMLERPKLVEEASRESAPFLEGDTARFISNAAGEIVVQAQAADRAGAASVSPRISFPDVDILHAMAWYMERRGAWLNMYAKQIGVEPLDDDLVLLREAVIAALRARHAEAASS